MRIGEENCLNLVAFAKTIFCEPPSRRPEVDMDDEEYAGFNSIPVKVKSCYQGPYPQGQFDVGQLQ